MPLINAMKLSGEALDYAVAKAYGLRVEKSFEGSGIVVFPDESSPDWVWLRHYNPSANWAIGGPIIERERLQIRPSMSTSIWLSLNISKDMDDWEFRCSGTTPLEAAMRCYVSSKLGDTVEIPEELL